MDKPLLRTHLYNGSYCSWWQKNSHNGNTRSWQNLETWNKSYTENTETNEL